MTELENARERLEGIIETWLLESSGHAKEPWYPAIQWLCTQLSSFLNGETVKGLENQLSYERAEKALVQQQFVTERARLREHLDSLRERLLELRGHFQDAQKDCAITKESVEQAVAAERERCASIFQQYCTQLGKEGLWRARRLFGTIIEAIRRPPEEVPDGKHVE